MPFRPFTVSLMNGQKFEVDFPNALIIRDGLGMFIGPGAKPWIFDYEGVTNIFGDLMSEQPGGENGTAGGGTPS